MQPINEMKVSDPNEAGVLQVLKLYKYTSPIVYTGTFFIFWNLAEHFKRVQYVFFW